MSYQYEDLQPDSTFRITKGSSGYGGGGHSGYGHSGGGYGGGGCSIGICEILAVGAAIAVAVAAAAALFLAIQAGKRRKRSMNSLDFFVGFFDEGSLAHALKNSPKQVIFFVIKMCFCCKSVILVQIIGSKSALSLIKCLIGVNKISLQYGIY